jgi:hypothetical protein
LKERKVTIEGVKKEGEVKGESGNRGGVYVT